MISKIDRYLHKYGYFVNSLHIFALIVCLILLIKPYLIGYLDPESIIFHDSSEFIEILKCYFNVVFPVYITLNIPIIIGFYKKVLIPKLHVPTMVACATIVLMGCMAVYGGVCVLVYEHTT